jgi:hypothetical protein
MLQALIDFTGHLTTKTYAFASATHSLPGTTPTTGIEEEALHAATDPHIIYSDSPSSDTW